MLENDQANFFKNENKPYSFSHKHDTSCWALAWNEHDGKSFATGSEDGTLNIFQSQNDSTFEISNSYKVHTQSIEDINWCPYNP